MPKLPQKIAAKKTGHPEKSSLSSTEGILYHQAFDNSFQPNIITTVSTGKIIMANSAARRLLGYSKKELITKSRSDIFDINESSFKKMLKQRTSGGHSKALVTAIKKSGKPLPCEITSAVFMDEHSIKKAITTIADMSENILKQKNIDIKNEKVVAANIVLAKSKQKKIDTRKEKIVADNIILALEKSEDEKLEQQIAAEADHKESFKLIFNSSSEVLFDSDLIADKIVISDSYEKEFGYKVAGVMSHEEDWISHIHPDDLERIIQEYGRVLASEETEWNCIYRFLKADNSIVNVSGNRVIMRDAAGKAYRIIGSMHDISKQKVLEERLEKEIRLKENQIAEAAEDAKDAERSDIGKELHDNVNQLLCLSKLYLDMAKQGGENSEMYLMRSSQYTITAIEAIRTITKRLTTDTIRNLGLCEAIDNVTRDTMEVSPVKISCKMDHFKEQSVNDKFKMTVFRIVQEQLNNILKHAKATKVAIRLLQNKKSIILSISDNGVGFDTGKKRNGIGVTNIKSRATFYHGIADFVSQPGEGCVLTVTFPANDELSRSIAAA